MFGAYTIRQKNEAAPPTGGKLETIHAGVACCLLTLIRRHPTSPNPHAALPALAQAEGRGSLNDAPKAWSCGLSTSTSTRSSDPRNRSAMPHDGHHQPATERAFLMEPHK